MTEPFLAEIRIFSQNFAPRGWANCDGQLLPINQNQALFSLLGTVYGGNGQTTFALPDLRDRVPIHFEDQGGHSLGERAGESAHTITIQELPQHQHQLMASSLAANSPSPTVPGPNVFAVSGGNQFYGPANSLTTFNPATVTTAGGSQPHPNMMPFLTLTFCIALQGIFPSNSG
jgi:microcystin-dependent protein